MPHLYESEVMTVAEAEKIANAREFSSVADSYDSLYSLQKELEFLIGRIRYMSKCDAGNPDANFGDMIDRNEASFMAGNGERPLQFSKEDMQRLVEIGDKLTRRM